LHARLSPVAATSIYVFFPSNKSSKNKKDEMEFKKAGQPSCLEHAHKAKVPFRNQRLKMVASLMAPLNMVSPKKCLFFVVQQ
jgi:hypothetical protein